MSIKYGSQMRRELDAQKKTTPALKKIPDVKQVEDSSFFASKKLLDNSC